MALAHCILGKLLGVGCHSFPPPLDVPTFSARCLHVQRRERPLAAEGGNLRGREMFRQISSKNNPNILHVKPLHTQRITVWSGFSELRVNDWIFFEDKPGIVFTVTSGRYLRMVNEFLSPELSRHVFDFAVFWFQQYGATAHTARPSINKLRTMS